MPLRVDVEDPLELHVQLDEVGIGTDGAVRAAQLGKESTLEEGLAEIPLGHRRQIDAGNEQTVGTRLDQRIARGAHSFDEPDVLPCPDDLGHARPDRQRSRLDVCELTLLDRAVEAQLLDRRVADGNGVVTLETVLGDLSGFDQHVEAMPKRIDAPVLIGQGAARSGVRPVPGTR